MSFPLVHADGETWDGEAVTDLEARAYAWVNGLYSTGLDAVVSPSNLQISGHSYMDPQGVGVVNGQGKNPNPYATAARLAALLGVQMGQVQNLAKSGAILRTHTSNGAPRYLQLINPGNAILWPVIPKTGVHFGWWGANDMIVGATSLAQKGFTNGYRSLISRYRASAVWDYDDPTVTKSGTWTEILYSAQSIAWGSGDGCWATSVVDSQITIAIPAAITQDAQPRTVALGFVTSSHGGSFEIRKDGTLQGVIDTRGCTWDDTERGANVFRLQVNPGDTQITIKLTSVDGGYAAYFDYWQVESDPSPLFLMGECTVPPAPPALWGGVTPAHVDTYNGWLQDLVTEFNDPSVRIVRLDAALGGTTIRANGQYSGLAENYRYYEYAPPSTSSLHPNDLGAQIAAEQIALEYRFALMFDDVHPRQLAGYDANSEQWPITAYQALMYAGDGAPLQLLDAFDIPDQDTPPAAPWTPLTGAWGIRGKQLAIIRDLVPPFPYTDYFERTNSSTNPGADWTVVHGTWGISNGELKCFAGGSPQAIVVNNQQLDINGDGGLEFTIGTVSENYHGVCFRYQDESNYWYLGESVTFGGWLLVKVVAGVQTTILSGAGALGNRAIGGVPCVMNIELHGDNIQVWNNNVLKADIHNAALQTKRGVGAVGYLGASSGGPTLPYFSVRSGPVTLTDTGYNAIVRDLGLVNGTFQWTQGVDSPVNWGGAIFRYVDKDNFLYLYESSTYGSWGFYKRIAGITTSVTSFGNTPVAGDVMQAVMKGNDITIYRNGVALGTGAYTIASCPQGTKAGFVWPYMTVWPTTRPNQAFDSAWAGIASVSAPDSAYYRDNQTGDTYGPYSKGAYDQVLPWLPSKGARTIELNTTGLTDAQIDALFSSVPVNGTVISDPTNGIFLVRQAGSWGRMPMGSAAAPSYAGSHPQPYDSTRNVYSLEAGWRLLRTKLAKAATGSLVNWGFIGDSKTAGYYVSNNDASKATPSVMRSLCAALGIPIAGTGFCCSSGGTGANDSRIVKAGTWGMGALWSAGSTGATQTFTSDVTGTVVDVYYFANAGAFTVTVDGGAPVTVTPPGGSTVQTYEVTGLANTVHTVVITALANNCYICGVEVRGTTGLRIHNFGVGGTKTSQWTPTAFANEMMVVLGLPFTLDILSVELGVNDLALGGVTSAQMIANFATIFGMFPNAAKMMTAQSAPGSKTWAEWTAWVANLYTVADANAVPLLDLTDRWGDSGSNAANGMVSSFDGLHETTAGYYEKALAIRSAIY